MQYTKDEKTSIGSELSYDLTEKQYDSKLELIFNREPRVYTFEFFDDLSTRFNLQQTLDPEWTLDQPCKATLNTAIDMEEVFKGNFKLLNFGLTFDFDLSPVD